MGLVYVYLSVHPTESLMQPPQDLDPMGAIIVCDAVRVSLPRVVFSRCASAPIDRHRG